MARRAEGSCSLADDSVITKVRDFIDTYGEENGYDYIYGKNDSGNILYGKAALDITDEVLKASNTAYSGAPAETPATEVENTTSAE